MLLFYYRKLTTFDGAACVRLINVSTGELQVTGVGLADPFEAKALRDELTCDHPACRKRESFFSCKPGVCRLGFILRFNES